MLTAIKQLKEWTVQDKKLKVMFQRLDTLKADYDTKIKLIEAQLQKEFPNWQKRVKAGDEEYLNRFVDRDMELHAQFGLERLEMEIIELERAIVDYGLNIMIQRGKELGKPTEPLEQLKAELKRLPFFREVALKILRKSLQ